ncbi:MAG: bifunctional metallophosphatase/5'-nucleotidase [Clostridia bacterium]|nr:bifunctional metallophosphatase/5'-nucleotidase [Clostridia bacterium]
MSLLIVGMTIGLLSGCGKAQEAAVETPVETPAETTEENDAEVSTEASEETAAEALEVTPPSEEIAIIYTNDVHCGITDNIGYSGLVAYKKELEASGKQVLLVDAGDSIQGGVIGALSSGGYPLEIMNYVGYDVATVGNHEFDYGMEQFMKLKDKAKFPYVCCNFMDLTTEKSVFDAYQMFTFGDTDVAFVGITTPVTLTSSTPKYFQNEEGEFIYGFCQDDSGQKLYDTVQSAIDDARAAGADYVIGLAHLGIESSTSPWMSTEVIAHTTGMDALIDGHSHTVMPEEDVQNKDGKTVVLTQTGTKLEDIGILTIATDGKLSSSLIDSAYETKDADTDAYIAKIMEQFDVQLSEVIGTSEVELVVEDPKTGVRIVRSAETNLGDFCADAYLAVTGADIAISNGGGIRAAVPAGEITYGDIINVHPFGNAICVIEATGQQILDALELGVMAMPEESGSFEQVAGITYEIHPDLPSSVVLDENGMFVSVDGEYRVQNVKVNGEELDLKKTYTLAGNNYSLMNGGGGLSMFKGNRVVQDSIMVDAEVLIRYIQDDLGGVIGKEYAQPYGQERIIAVE